MWAFEKPAGPGHVDIDPAEQIAGGMITNQFCGLFEVFQTVFLLTFMNVGEAQAKISLGESTPIAGLTIPFQSPLGIITRDVVFGDVPINASERSVNRANFKFILGQITKRCVKQRNGFGMIAVVVVRQGYLDP
jgi:hypothetical protein